MKNSKLLAVGEVELGEIESFGQGIADPSTPGQTLANLVSAIIGLLTVFAVIYFMINLLTGALGIISSGGDKGKYAEARQKITYGFIGLTVSIAAIFILGLLGILLDIPIMDIEQIEGF